ncbi:MAG: hypothetical protein IT193_12820, partial [Propionibacteriaceae bacterium]|nr:hypothetical protein [Propionibacteriaceae bacterium]
ARPAPTTPAGGSRLLLRPWPGDPLPGRPAARIPDLTDPPTPAPAVPVESMWPELAPRPAPEADPGPPATVQLARWLRLTSEQAAT